MGGSDGSEQKLLYYLLILNISLAAFFQTVLYRNFRSFKFINFCGLFLFGYFIFQYLNYLKDFLFHCFRFEFANFLLIDLIIIIIIVGFQDRYQVNLFYLFHP